MKTSLVIASSLLVVVIFVIKNSFKEVSLLPHKPKTIEKDSTRGFKPLFDGKSFDDWKLLLRNGTAEEIEKVFTIDHDGTLHFFRDLPEGSGNDETRRNAFHGIMATKKNYSRYHLKFEYKWGKKLVNNYDQFQYDAGVFYHIKELKIWPVGLQYQIRYNHITNKNHSGDFVASNVKMQWFSQDDKTFKLPSEGGTPQPIRKGQHFAAKDLNFNGLNDKWNTGEVIVMGDEYALHFLNGKLANMAKNLEPNEGPIAFEAETGEIYWRNIRIKEFKKSVPMQNFVN
jgi:hypothetical protein